MGPTSRFCPPRRCTLKRYERGWEALDSRVAKQGTGALREALVGPLIYCLTSLFSFHNRLAKRATGMLMGSSFKAARSTRSSTAE